MGKEEITNASIKHYILEKSRVIKVMSYSRIPLKESRSVNDTEFIGRYIYLYILLYHLVSVEW